MRRCELLELCSAGHSGSGDSREQLLHSVPEHTTCSRRILSGQLPFRLREHGEMLTLRNREQRSLTMPSAAAATRIRE